MPHRQAFAIRSLRCRDFRVSSCLSDFHWREAVKQVPALGSVHFFLSSYPAMNHSLICWHTTFISSLLPETFAFSHRKCVHDAASKAKSLKILILLLHQTKIFVERNRHFWIDGVLDRVKQFFSFLAKR